MQLIFKTLNFEEFALLTWEQFHILPFENDPGLGNPTAPYAKLIENFQNVKASENFNPTKQKGEYKKIIESENFKPTTATAQFDNTKLADNKG